MPEPDASSPPEDLNVLVVTDDSELVHKATFGFPNAVTIRVAGDAREALALMRENVPSVAVVDIQTGSAGGIALARDMASDGRLASVPILMLLERVEDEWLAKHLGAQLVRTKPIETTQLVRDTLELARP